jgi:hypothetical protein
MPTKVFIVVYKHPQFNNPDFCYSIIYLLFADDTQATVNISDTTGFVCLEDSVEATLSQNRILLKIIPIAEISDFITRAAISDMISNPPISDESETSDWQCNTWVADVLDEFIRHGLINCHQRELAMERMFDACLGSMGG